MRATINGINVVYTDEGKGSALVFIHGFPLNRGTWQKQVEALRTSYRVIAPDLRGLGESEAGVGVSTMDQFAQDVHALLQQIHREPVVLIGHSMGGYAALAFARLFPKALGGLVLVGTRAGNDSPEAAAGRRTLADKVKAEGAKVLIEAMAAKMIAASNQDPKLAEEVRGFMASTKPQGAMAALLGMAERPDSTPMLKTIAAPTLVITGVDDVLIPPTESQKLAEAIPSAQLRIIPGAGHLVAYERAGDFNRVLTEWLDKLYTAS